MKEILDILRGNAKETPESIAKMLDLDVTEVEARIAEYEEKGIIKGYQAIIDEDEVEWGHFYREVMPTIWKAVKKQQDKGKMDLERINAIADHKPGEYYYVWSVEHPQ